MSVRSLLPLVFAAFSGVSLAQSPTPSAAPVMQRYLIEREIPGASQLSLEEFQQGAAKSNAVLRLMGPDIQWIQSYVAGDKVYCIYQAPNEAMIREHAERSGFPANRITRIARVVDPTTANPRP
jgi:hypothetical protein